MEEFMTTKSSASHIESLGNFELIKNYQDLARYSDQIVAVQGSPYFNKDQTFSFSANPIGYAYVSSRISDAFEGGKGYTLSTLYKPGTIESVAVANEYTLEGYTLYVRTASTDELKRIKIAVKASLAKFSVHMHGTESEKALALLEHV
jgi:hypothetical protein